MNTFRALSSIFLLLTVRLTITQTVLFAQPLICGCRDIQDTYNDKPGILYGTHHYTVGKVVICNRRQEGCTSEFVYETLLSNASFAAPAAAAIAVEDCHDYHVSFAYGLGGGHITIKLDRENYQLTTYTRKDHTLHPGKVIRQVIEQPNGDIIVRSTGFGSGFLPSVNESKAPSLWSEVEELLRKEVQKKLPPVETVPFAASAVGTQPSGKQAEACDLVIVEVQNTANLGWFTTDVPASGIAVGRQQYNKPQYASLPHGVLILHQGGSLYPCRRNPFTAALSAEYRLSINNASQADGVIFLARQTGDIRFKLNDQFPNNNWGDYDVAITIVPYSQHRGRDTQTALSNYLSTFQR